TYPGLDPTTYERDEADLVTEIHGPGDKVETLTYHADGPIATRTVRRGTNVVEEETYRYDALGALKYAANRAAVVVRENNSFGQVKHETVSPVGGTAQTVSYEYDAG